MPIFRALLYSLLISAQVHAMDLKREISLEWDEIPDSTAYQLEFVRLANDPDRSKKPLILSAPSPSWTGRIRVGKYQFRIRSLDARGVPGPWGPPEEVTVTLAPPIPRRPANGTVLRESDAPSGSTDFEWDAVPGAASYEITVRDEKDEIVASETVERTRATLRLPLERKYSWSVTARGERTDEVGPMEAPWTITLTGPKLDAPSIARPLSKYVTDLNWESVSGAKSYTYKLSRKSKNGDWTPIDGATDLVSTSRTVNPKIRGGWFRLEVIANSDTREPSEPAVIEFPVHEGLRSPAAIETAQLREAIDRDYDRYLQATYWLSNLTYTGINREKGSNLSFQALAGTGRVGFGYFPRGRWGFLGEADASGVVINGKNFVHASASASAVWRRYLARAAQVRLNGGVTVKQLPEAKGFNERTVDVARIGQAGPVIGAQVHYAMSSRLGLLISGQGSLAIFKLTTPNGQPLSSTLSYQSGVLGSYRLSANLTGALGVSYRRESAAYKATPYSGGGEANFAAPGDVNRIEMKGAFLTLYLEWGL